MDFALLSLTFSREAPRPTSSSFLPSSARFFFFSFSSPLPAPLPLHCRIRLRYTAAIRTQLDFTLPARKLATENSQTHREHRGMSVFEESRGRERRSSLLNTKHVASEFSRAIHSARRASTVNSRRIPPPLTVTVSVVPETERERERESVCVCVANPGGARCAHLERVGTVVGA